MESRSLREGALSKSRRAGFRPRAHSGRRSVGALLSSACAMALTGCALSQTGPTPFALTGVWGGDHISMTVTDAGTHLEFDCAYGDISGALIPDSAGAVETVGTYVRERGGPIRLDETPESHPAQYNGRVTENTMQLTIRLVDRDVLVGTFVLTRGASGRVVKCL